MPLEIRRESVFCLDFTRKTENYIPYEITIPELIEHKCSTPNRVAIIFDSEKIELTYGIIKNEMESMAAGLLSTGLKFNDRILIAGYNHSQVIITALAASRAGFVFSLASPNFSNSEQLKELLVLGQFRAVILFSIPGTNSDYCNNLILSICPELKSSHCGKIKSKTLPYLTHVILANEDHKHAGCYTISEILSKSSKEKIEKLPNYKQWNSHKLAAIQFTMGTTGSPKAVGLTHYQLINGCRIAANAIGILNDAVLCCALPIFKIPIFCLVVFTPFFLESRSIFPEPSPLPKNLFNSIKKFQCTTLLSNAAALRLLLKTCALVQRVSLPSINTVILLGERVSTELYTVIDHVMKNATKIAVGMLLTEVGAIPLLSDNTTNLAKFMGKVLVNGYEIDIEKIEKLKSYDINGKKKLVGELKLKSLTGTKFLGYGPNFNAYTEWINTNDVVSVDDCGNVELITYKTDLMYNRNNFLIEHWLMERVMAQHKYVKGVQVVQICMGSPIVAVFVTKLLKIDVHAIKSDLILLCREHNVYVPEQFAVMIDFPRLNTRIQKYKIRELLKQKAIQTF